MKKILVALGFALSASMANAAIVNHLEVYNETTVVIKPSDRGWGPINVIAEGGYLTGSAGTLKALADGVFTATYLGQVATLGNFYLGETRMNGTTNGGKLGATNSMNVFAGEDINFGFGEDRVATIFQNGQTNQQNRGILYFANTFGLMDAKGQLFDFLIGYNDTARVNADYDDYVVGVVNAVPVPAALPLMASAIGAFGLARRRNKAKKAA